MYMGGPRVEPSTETNKQTKNKQVLCTRYFLILLYWYLIGEFMVDSGAAFFHQYAAGVTSIMCVVELFYW